MSTGNKHDSGAAQGAGHDASVFERFGLPRSTVIVSTDEFGAKPYNEDEERSLSEIIRAFNERHGTQFTRDDFVRFEQVNRTIIDHNMAEMLRNNPPMWFTQHLHRHSLRAPSIFFSGTMR